MTVIRDISLTLTEEQIWRGQGGRRPEQVRPALRALMQRALEVGQPLFEPRIAYGFFEVGELRHGQVALRNGAILRSAGQTTHLARAEQVALVLCTIGPALDERVRQLLDTEMALAATLDGVGSAAVDALSTAACRRIEEEAARAGLRTTMPFSPGDGDWPLADQQVFFDLLPVGELGMRLTRDHLMTPLKSLTLVIGIGKEASAGGVPCERCSAAPRCRYRVDALDANSQLDGGINP
jgi:hypothetical protein